MACGCAAPSVAPHLAPPPLPPAVPPSAPPLPAAPEENGQFLELPDADLPREPAFVVDGAPLQGALGRFAWFKGGFFEELRDDRVSRVSFWPVFGEASQPLFLVTGRCRELTADPEGERLAYLLYRLKNGQYDRLADVYLWSKAGGSQRLVATTPGLELGGGGLTWSADGRWLVTHAHTNDCPWQEADPQTGAGRGPIEQRSCDRMVLIDSQTGRVSYRTPAALDPRYVDVWTGPLLIHAGDRGQNRELIIGEHSSPELGRWWRLDPPTLTLALGRPPAHTSPDGKFRILSEDGWKTRVVTTDGRRNYLVDRALAGRILWLGPHHLALRGRSWYGATPAPADIVVDLETRQARRLWPEGYEEAAVSPDGESAVLHWQRGTEFERRWARKRERER
jgi:hypothetical protein